MYDEENLANVEVWPMYVIREIEEKDNARIEQIIKQSLEDVGLNIPGTSYVDPQLGNLTQYYAELPNAKYWVAENEEGEVVGGVGIAPLAKQEGVCELQKLYITPEARGNGLSHQLMEAALAFAKKHYAYCYLDTFEKLYVANLLYEKYGFEELEQPLEGTEHNACDKWFMKKLS